MYRRVLHASSRMNLLVLEVFHVYFKKYYYPNTAPIKFEDIKKYGLKEEEIFKPLFCWMLRRIQSEFELSALENVIDQNAKRSLIYQQFIHSTIVGLQSQSIL
jgi:hypothetical protein